MQKMLFVTDKFESFLNRHPVLGFLFVGLAVGFLLSLDSFFGIPPH